MKTKRPCVLVIPCCSAPMVCGKWYSSKVSPERRVSWKTSGHKSVDPDVFHETLRSGDTLLLCSDGLWEMVRHQGILSVLKQERDAQKICDTLVDMANANGGEDNITAVVVQIS